jgi:hypothetical protein
MGGAGENRVLQLPRAKASHRLVPYEKVGKNWVKV